MRKRMMAVVSVLATSGLLMAAGANSQSKPAQGFERLRTLAGTWQGKSPEGKDFTTTIREVSNGTALEETIQSSEDNQMVTLYVPDGAKIVMTHYCSAGNQPRMETGTLSGDAKVFAFRFTGITNLRSPETGHMKHLVIEIADKDHFSERWTWAQDGKDRVEVFQYTRKS